MFGGEAGQAAAFEDIAHLVQSARRILPCAYSRAARRAPATYTMLGATATRTPATAAKPLIPRCRRAPLPPPRSPAVTPPRPQIPTSAATMVEIYAEALKLLSDTTDAAARRGARRTNRRDAAASRTRRRCCRRLRRSLVRRAAAARTTRATKMNDHSSRSHMVFTAVALTGVDAKTYADGETPASCVWWTWRARSVCRARARRATTRRDVHRQSPRRLGDVIAAQFAAQAPAVPKLMLTYLLRTRAGRSRPRRRCSPTYHPSRRVRSETLCSLRVSPPKSTGAYVNTLAQQILPSRCRGF